MELERRGVGRDHYKYFGDLYARSDQVWCSYALRIPGMSLYAKESVDLKGMRNVQDYTALLEQLGSVLQDVFQLGFEPDEGNERTLWVHIREGRVCQVYLNESGSEVFAGRVSDLQVEQGSPAQPFVDSLVDLVLKYHHPRDDCMRKNLQQPDT